MPQVLAVGSLLSHAAGTSIAARGLLGHVGLVAPRHMVSLSSLTGIEPMPSVLQGGFLSTGPQGKP